MKYVSSKAQFSYPVTDSVASVESNSTQTSVEPLSWNNDHVIENEKITSH